MSLNEKVKIVSHHGSPGSSNDWLQIKSVLHEYDWDLVDRNKNNWPERKHYDVGVAYSWGSMRLFRDLISKKYSVDKIILVSPYLTQKSLGIIGKLITNLPIIKKVFFKTLAPKMIERFVKDTCLPGEIPQDYAKEISFLASQKTLTLAITEKEKLQVPSTSELQIFSDIPLLVFFGKHDQSVIRESTIELLKKSFKHVRVVEIDDGNHALTWTHAKRIGVIMKHFIATNECGNRAIKGRLGYYDGENIKNNVYSFLEEHMQKIPERVVLKWVDRNDLKNWPKDINVPLPHKEMKVKELKYFVDRISKGLHDIGIKKGDRVILFLPMSTYMYATMFALQKIGAIPVFLDSWARRNQLGISAEAVAPKAMISFKEAFELCKGASVFDNMPIKISLGPSVDGINNSIEKCLQSTGEVSPAALRGDDTALITFTTGSSGTPKGANRTHKFLAAQHYALQESLVYNENDVDLPVFPIFSLNNLAEGVATVIPAFDVGSPSPHDGLVLFAQIKSTNTTCTTLSPSLLNGLTKYCIDNNLSLDFLKRVVTGGAPISRDNVIAFKKTAKNGKLLILYGSTEVEPIAHIEGGEILHLKSLSDIDSELEDDGVNVGKIDVGLNYRFIKIDKGIIKIKTEGDWKNISVKTDEVGELIVAGEHVCREYYNNTEAFDRAKILDEKNIVWHRTGDLGRIDNNGNLWLLGRVHNAICRNNIYAFPVRAEIVLKKLLFVQYCAYLGLPDSTLGESIICVIVPKDLHLLNNSSQKELALQKVKRILEKNKIIYDEIIFREKIPMDPRHHSKVEYSLLRDELLKQKS